VDREVSRGKRRPYKQQRRAESALETRQRITEAAVKLHTSIGPSEASLRAIAKEAGVTRVTLARHFSSGDELFAACMSHWTAQHLPPDPGPLLAIPDFAERIRRALLDMYSWYAANGGDLYPIYRDFAYTPEGYRQAAQGIIEGIADALLAGVSGSADQMARRRAAIILVVGFWGWHSLQVQSGLSVERAAELAATLILAA
jgi:AcrR family transcriptional regulator